jgi:anti-anti-sigma factor
MKTMLQFTMPLTASPTNVFSVNSEYLPVASLNFDFNGCQKCVKIILEGAIAGKSAVALGDFLKNVASIPATRWMLQMKDLEILSRRGIRHLIQFAKIIRRRGLPLEIQGVHPNVHAILQDLNLTQVFGYID